MIWEDEHSDFTAWVPYFSDWYRPFWVITLSHHLTGVKCFYLCGCFCGLSLWIPILWIHVEYMDRIWTRLAQKQVAVGEYPTCRCIPLPKLGLLRVPTWLENHPNTFGHSPAATLPTGPIECRYYIIIICSKIMRMYLHM